jgi:hypothetical protein
LVAGKKRFGRADVAQLAERLLRKQNVAGSIPAVGSIQEKRDTECVAFFYCAILVAQWRTNM